MRLNATVRPVPDSLAALELRRAGTILVANSGHFGSIDLTGTINIGSALILDHEADGAVHGFELLSARRAWKRQHAPSHPVGDQRMQLVLRPPEDSSTFEQEAVTVIKDGEAGAYVVVAEPSGRVVRHCLGPRISVDLADGVIAGFALRLH